MEETAAAQRAAESDAEQLASELEDVKKAAADADAAAKGAAAAVAAELASAQQAAADALEAERSRLVSACPAEDGNLCAFRWWQYDTSLIVAARRWSSQVLAYACFSKVLMLDMVMCAG